MAQSIRTLIIDDSPDDRETYVRTLKKVTQATYDYTEAKDGTAGLALLKESPFDCVLLDYSLPGMNGLEVLREIRMQDTFLPVILLTGQGNEMIAVEALKKGAHDYIVKSTINPERLHQTIQSAISQSSLRRDIIEKDAHIRYQAAELSRSVIELEAIKAQQEQLITRLMESNSELERFAYVCSHDLQEPLRMIANFTQRMQIHLGKSLDERGRHYMLYITDGTTHARKLINDVLNYARIDHENKPVEDVNGEEALWNVLRDLSENIRESEAIVTHDLLPWLPIQPTHLRQILQNLISNALKFTDDIPKVHISAKHEGAFWQIGVHDNGIGIDPEHYDKVFNIFQRLNNHDDYPGTGIGLALCKKLVQKYGGKIWVESKSGEGSTFYFTLPAQKVSITDAA